MTPMVKICGLTRPEDASLAAALGADWIGVVLVPNTPRARTAEQAAELLAAARAESPQVKLAIVVDAGVGSGAVADSGKGIEPVQALAEAARRSGAHALQLHGAETPELVRALRREGGWELWKALRVRAGDTLLFEATRWAGEADLLLLDGWHPSQLGGAGVTFPWEALEAIRAQWPEGLQLGAAGGLRPDTVGEAIARLRPDLVDVSSGVELAPGQKDPERLRAFLAAAAAARHPER
jgi:phosphoribosylanthranilate isomerase